MSLQDLKDLIKKVEVDPPIITESSSISELVGQREDVAAIVAQRDIEGRFNHDIDPDFILEPLEVFDPAEAPSIDTPRPFTSESVLGDFKVGGKRTMFALGYSGRLLRSVLALSGTSAIAERFGDVRKSQGFWVAMADLIHINPLVLGGEEGFKDVLRRQQKQIEEVPALLTDPDVPETSLPSVGDLIAEVEPKLEPAAWVLNVIGELYVEKRIGSTTLSVAKKGLTKLTKSAYQAPKAIVKKGGIKRLLGQLDDDELRAIDDAITFRRVGKLGTKPAKSEIDDAVRRTFDYIEESKPSRLTKKEVISAKRKVAASKMYDIQGDGYGPGYSARLRKAGAITKSDRSFTPLLEAGSELRPRKIEPGRISLAKWIRNRTKINQGKLGAPKGDIDSALKRVSEEIRKGDFPDELDEPIQRFLQTTKDLETGELIFPDSPEFPRTGTLINFLEDFDQASSELIRTGVNFKAIDDLNTLQRTIDNFDFGGSKIYTTTNTQEALAKLYEYGELLTPGEVEGLRDVFGKNFADSLEKFVDKPTGVAGKLFDAGTKGLRQLNQTSRTLMTTGELSFLLRQGNFRAWSRPKDAVRAWSVANRSLISTKYADHIDDAMRFSRVGKVGTEHGLFLGKWREVRRLTEREEVFMAEWLDKLPIIGRIKTGFERGYVNGLNQIRLDWFDEGLQIIENTGRAADDELISKWAAYVNNMTGRADIDNIAEANKALKSMAEIAKDTLFAPRFAVSKWNRHKVAAELVFGRQTPNQMRVLLVTDAVKKWRRYERFAHFATLNGFEVEFNPQSSDFLKLKEKGNNTRHDVLGGDTQLQVLLARLATGQTKDLATGVVKDNIASEIAQRYLAGKLNPLWSLIIDKTFGRTFDGKDIDDPKVLAKVIRDKFIPLYINDIKDKIFNEYEEQGKTVTEAIGNTLLVAAHGYAGGGIQTFAPSARKQYELMIEDKAQELHGVPFDVLSFYLKEQVIWEAENDDIDKTELLKEEMGMRRQTRSTSARIAGFKNKSFRAIRKELGKDYRLFEESNIPIREFPIDIQDVRLSKEQHEKLSSLYVKFIKAELKLYPDMRDIPPKLFQRRRWLEDIESNAREDAIAELIFEE